ncbi:MAG: two-component system response regulator [Desulfuromonas sp.]|nr:MAG: two-component system response regulator [Desulfuromonas sp.]
MSKKSVVVIDDCAFHLQLVREILEPAGYEVITAESPIAANTHIFKTPPPSLLLVDVEMPMINGVEKVRLLKKREASRSIPALLMSTKSTQEMAALAADSGADGFLCKPFKKDDLLREVDRYI